MMVRFTIDSRSYERLTNGEGAIDARQTFTHDMATVPRCGETVQIHGGVVLMVMRVKWVLNSLPSIVLGWR